VAIYVVDAGYNRAVVAAGWAVQDAAGRTFARTFYERFLMALGSGMPSGSRAI
jgi:hypothetical protein